jgi:hypothetical protein
VIWSLDATRTLVRGRRLVIEGAARVRSQRERLKRLRVAGLDTADAEELLGLLENSQLAMIASPDTTRTSGPPVAHWCR